MDTRERVHEWLQGWFGTIAVAEFEPGVTLGSQLEATPAEWLAAFEMPPVPDGVIFEPDVVYGTGGGRELTLQLFRRADVSLRGPGMVFVHGGAWSGGHPYLHMRHASDLAARGMVTASISYRFAQEAPFPAALEDAKCAVRFMRANADTLGLDPSRIAVAGGSAGGHLSAMIALTPGRFEGSGGHAQHSSEVQAAVLWYPMTDMTAPGAASGTDLLCQSFLGESSAAEASPITYVHPEAPPILTLTGDRDVLTPAPMIEQFHAALQRAGVANHLQVYRGGPHGFDFAPAAWHDCFARMAAWLGSHL